MMLLICRETYDIVTHDVHKLKLNPKSFTNLSNGLFRFTDLFRFIFM